MGRRPAARLRRVGRVAGVNLVGAVPDVRPYLAAAAVVVVPLRIARGVQNKVLEALAMGKAVVASPQALTGLEVEPGVHAMAASSPGEWVESVARLLEDDALRRELGSAGRRFVEEHHGWATCLKPFESLLGLSRETALDDFGNAVGGSAPTQPSVSASERTI